jgi:tetratricopeptide (TPR) repeat protein
MSLAQASRMTNQREQADELFEEVEALHRGQGNPASLADALYWHGVVLESMKRAQSALEKWREEEAIRRELGQQGHLAECLYAQADTLRLTREYEAAEPLFDEAIAIFEAMEMVGDLDDALYRHGMSLRAGGKSADALVRADEALGVARANDDQGVERLAQGLRAMALADLGDIAAAGEALDAAEALCEQSQTHSAMVWTLARRAYLIACGGGQPEEVVEQLKRAHTYAAIHGEPAAGRSAIRKIASEITSRCGESFAESLDAMRHEQLEEAELMLRAGMPANLSAPVPDVAGAPAPEAADDDFDDASEER